MNKHENKVKMEARGAIRKFKEIEQERILDIDAAGIIPLGTDEMFVLVENSNTFYISNYGRGALVTDRARLVDGFIEKKKLIYRYPVWINGEYSETERFADWLVANTFIEDADKYKYIWHMGDDLEDNYYLNLVPVTHKEHAALIKYVKAGGFDTIDTVAEIIDQVINEPTILDTGYWGMREVDPGHWTYVRWVDMLMRCYSDKFHNFVPAYVGCTVDPRWHCYANFKKWVEDNYYEVDGESMDLDKDILYKGNTVYSPDTCVFAPRAINSLLVNRKISRGEYPIGVELYKGKYRARMAYDGKQTMIGNYSTVEEAFMAYKQYKESLIKEMANRYRYRIPEKLYNALISREIEIDD